MPVGAAFLLAFFVGGANPALSLDEPNSVQTATRATPSKAPNSDYLLDEGDAITVVVYNHPELSGDFLVPRGGVVVFPIVGDTVVAGKSLKQVSEELTKNYNKELYNPNVSVVLKTARPQQVTVVGDVQKPGAVQIITGQRLADAVSIAGGLLPDLKAADTTVTVLSQNGTAKTFPLQDILFGRPNANLLLRNGDTIEIDSGTFQVYVVGQVKFPGVQRLSRGAGLLQAIGSSGGQTDVGLISKVRITHVNGQEEVVDLVPSLVRGESQTLPRLRRGDVITVPQSNAQITVLGYLAEPGVFAFPDGKTYTLADAIGLAKGHDLAKRASFSHVVLVRKINGQDVHYVYNLGKYFKKGDSTQNPEVLPGDFVYVPETDAPPVTSIIQAVASLGIFFSYAIR